MNNKVSAILKEIETKYSHFDTILVFGSVLTENWTDSSDIDVFLIDDSLKDSRSEEIYDDIIVELQKDNFDSIREDVEAERGALLNRNVSTMIATSKILSTNLPNRANELINLAKEVLLSKPIYNEEDLFMWRYSIPDYLAKSEKDVKKNDEIAFYVDAHYVLQNALEMSLAIHGQYMPQPKFLSKLLEEKDPKFLQIWREYLKAQGLNAKFSALAKINDVINI